MASEHFAELGRYFTYEYLLFILPLEEVPTPHEERSTQQEFLTEKVPTGAVPQVVARWSCAIFGACPKGDVSKSFLNRLTDRLRVQLTSVRCKHICNQYVTINCGLKMCTGMSVKRPFF